MISGKVYRDVYIYTNMPSLNLYGDKVYYYGTLYTNAKNLKHSNYNSTLDLMIVCNTCASKKYSNFIKVSKPK